MRRSVCALALVAARLGACGDDDEPSTPAPTRRARRPAPTYEGEPYAARPRRRRPARPAVGPMRRRPALAEADGTSLDASTGHLHRPARRHRRAVRRPHPGVGAAAAAASPSLPVDGLGRPGVGPGPNDLGAWVEGEVGLTGVVDGDRRDVPSVGGSSRGALATREMTPPPSLGPGSGSREGASPRTTQRLSGLPDVP